VFYQIKQMATDKGPSYYVDVYYDILDDDYCLWTIYRFTSKDIALRFIEEVPFVCGDIQYNEHTILHDTHIDTHPFRPIYSNLEDALNDAYEFHKYGRHKEYKYHGRVFEEDLSVIERVHDKNTIKKLMKENEELKSRIAQLQRLQSSV
jgi:hypothetical protein